MENYESLYEHYSFLVDKGQEPLRIDKYLMNFVENATRSKIQAAAKLRGSISDSVKVRYAYYASDNPLETGSTLASGGLGTTGVKPTYLITEQILEQIFKD